MSIQILMPALSPTMTEGKLAKWHVKVGDAVKSGQVICEIETDKATMEVEAVDEGTRRARSWSTEGTEGVAVNTPICVLAGEGESAADAAKSAPPAAPPQAAAKAEVADSGEARRRRRRLPPRRASAAAAPAPEPEWTGKTRAHDRARGAARRDGRGDAQGRATSS